MPTKQRMDELWREMLGWPTVNRMSFAVALAHICMDDAGLSQIDAGHNDRVAGRDVYLVAGCGGGADELKAAVRAMVADGRPLRPVKVGEQATPLSGDPRPWFVDAGNG